MWQPFRLREQAWDIDISNPAALASASDAAKHAHELRMLNLLLPTIIGAPPKRVTKRESPDFEIVGSDGPLFIEIVDAVPDGNSTSSAMNLGKRRSRPNPDTYQVDAAQFGTVIAHEIAAKRRKASTWVHRESELVGRLVLLVNGGVGPLWLRHYLRDPDALSLHVGVAAIDPFTVIALGDETGAFVWGTPAASPSQHHGGPRSQ